ncbi:hypothetical protein POM88_001951 [Heracleum sosnowskyi]|uniref:Pentatricopeptide repeat-containing protein n=1 Tax=Heracleum sosnowskyi TaxID=360622 RepID=A0AAD8NBB2_9APIA|nr:hypothetical protein POM88_001951 [Heracleum sosnowskyi]
MAWSITGSISRDVTYKKQCQVSLEKDSEFSQRLKWLQAAVLGPNDCYGCRSSTAKIEIHCKRQKVDKAIDLLRQMPAEGLKPGVETYNTIIHGLFQMGRHGEARNLFNELLSNGDKPDIITCRILLDGFCKNQQIDEAISFFGLMECNGIIHDIQIYNILITTTT